MFRKFQHELELAMQESSMISVLDTYGNFTYANPYFKKITGYQDDELIGKPFSLLFPLLASENELQSIYRRVATGEIYRGEFEQQTKEGEVFFAGTTILGSLAEAGEIERMIVVQHDMTNLKLQNKVNEHAAHHDVITDLPNKRGLDAYMEKLIGQHEEGGPGFVVYFLDLDDFKNINDSVGHHAGDEVLQELAERLKRLHIPGAFLSRRSGDEFIVIMEGQTGEQEVTGTAERLLSVFERRYSVLEGKTAVSMTGSVGISLFPNDGVHADELLHKADVAMYRAKTNGKNGFAFYGQEWVDNSHSFVRILESLNEEVTSEELYVRFAPQYDLLSKQMVGYEACVDWKQHVEGQLTCGKIVKLAEEFGLSYEIHDWILRRSIQIQHEWKEEKKVPLPVTVAVGRAQLENAFYIDQIIAYLHEFEVKPSELILGIPEILLSDTERVREFVERATEEQIAIVIDEFGDGYSSFRYLSEIPIAGVKINAQFLQKALRSERSQKLVEGAIKIANSLGIHTTALGVQSEIELALLRKFGCDAIQNCEDASNWSMEQIGKSLPFRRQTIRE